MSTLGIKFCAIVINVKFNFFLEIAIRGWIGIQIFFAVFMVYALRVTISINLLAMVKETGGKTEKNITSECVLPSFNNESENGPKLLPDVSEFS